MPLTPQQMARISRLLDQALPLDKAQRRSWLDTLADEHQDLARVLRQALLPEDYPDFTARTNFSLPELDGSDESGIVASGLIPGNRVGPYELMRLLGTGGMAEVWLARRADGVFKREVALKLPMLTRMRLDLPQRFARERDILASLEHAHIARLYDAGVDAQGLPYLSMEFVQGEQLSDWCDTRRLDIRARLQLFLQVLDAVQYAHERHVIHRDLKPSNILVTTDGQVRLLDFGVAKLLQDQVPEEGALLTSVFGQALTPAYASPELVRGDPVDARSDIYSLGVLLFEMLTGDRPYRLNAGASRGMIEQAIALAEVEKPSAQLTTQASAARAATRSHLARLLHGDLDVIVLKALAKEPQARYASAAALKEDLQHYLHGEPIAARPPRLSYRVGKFVGRNRAVVAIAVSSLIVLLIISGYDAWRRAADRDPLANTALRPAAQLRRSIGEKSIAVMPFLDLSEKKDQGYFSDGLTEELINLLARIPNLQVIARTSSFYFKDKQIPVAKIAATLGVAHVLEGSVQRAGHTIRVTAQLIRADSSTPLWAETYEREAKDIFQVQDEIAASVVGALKLKLLSSAQTADPYRSDNADAYNQFLLGKQLAGRGDSENYRRAATAYRRATELDPRYAAAYAGLSFMETRLANNDLNAAGFARARAAADTALALSPRLIDGYRARAAVRRETLNFAGARADGEMAMAIAPGDSVVQSFYGVGLALFGRIDAATRAMNRAVELDPLNSYAWANLGIFLTAQRDYPAARRAVERAIAINQDDYSFHMALGQLNLLEGRLEDALLEFEKKGSDVGSRMGEAMVAYARGQDFQSQQALKVLIAQHAQDSTYQIGEVYAWRGEKDKAFEWLEKAYQQRDSGLNGLAYDPLLTGLQSDVRYASLMKKLKLTE